MKAEPYRHWIRLGSNYLFLDGHVGALDLKRATSQTDPWDFPDPT